MSDNDLTLRIESLKSGADAGVKTAAACAIKAATEKSAISIPALPTGTLSVIAPIPVRIPPVLIKGLPGAAYAGIASVAVDTAKTAYKLANGELSAKEAVAEIQDTAASTAGGIYFSVKGGAAGATIGAVLGPAGSFIGGVVGSVVGYAAGSSVGKTISQGMRKINDAGVKLAKAVASKAADVAKSVGSTIKSGLSRLASFIF